MCACSSDGLPEGAKGGRQNPLTGIPRRIHYAATPEGETPSGADQIMIEDFLDTLAEIALKIASRTPRTKGPDGTP